MIDAWLDSWTTVRKFKSKTFDAIRRFEERGASAVDMFKAPEPPKPFKDTVKDFARGFKCPVLAMVATVLAQEQYKHLYRKRPL